MWPGGEEFSFPLQRERRVEHSSQTGLPTLSVLGPSWTTTKPHKQIEHKEENKVGDKLVVTRSNQPFISAGAPAALPLPAPFPLPKLKKYLSEDLLHCSQKLQLRNPPSVHR